MLNGGIEIHGKILGMTTIVYSSVGSGETLIERQFKLQLASGHFFDPVLHQQFVDQDRRLTDLSPVENMLTQFTFFTSDSQLHSCGSP
ncbi:hypothetical protein HAX54_029071, partial [Datura stramonium]|nr:hypothetical protein [Datura stramonium]